MGFIIGLLTFILVMDCIVLVLLVLIQLPKKEAGAGLAFGGAASDALFGAGSGNVLTKITKWTASTFFVLAILLSLIQTHARTRGTSKFADDLEKGGNAPIGALPPGPGPAPATAVPTSTNNSLVPAGIQSTNLLVAPPGTNALVPPPATNVTPPPPAN